MPVPTVLASASTAASLLNASVGLAAAVKKLHNSADRNTSKKNEITDMSLERKILPGDLNKDREGIVYIDHPLMSYILDSCSLNTGGNSHVIYAPSSVGKTTACRAFMELAAPKRNMQALMITKAGKNSPYLSHLARELDVANEEDTLIVLLEGMRTVDPTPASMLILDEMNDVGPGNCNIDLVDVIMRYIYENEYGIHLMVVTQSKLVADKLCMLNLYNKIGPLDGLTIPTRTEVGGGAPCPREGEELVWDSAVSAWSVEMLTLHIDTHPRFKKKGLVKNDGIYPWLRKGMTPTQAQQRAYKEIDNMMLQKAQKEAETSGGSIPSYFVGVLKVSKLQK